MSASIIAARAGIRQLELLHAANQAGSTVDSAIVRAWNRLMRLLTRKPLSSHWQLQHEARHLLTQIYLAAYGGLRDSLGRLAMFGHKAAAADLMRTLPLKILKAAAGQPRRRLFSEAISTHDALGRLREPVRAALTDAEQRELLAKLLFPAPTAQMVTDILHRPIHGSNWEQDLSTASRLAGFDPALLTLRLISGISQGKAPREVAKDLLPAVDGVKSSARRIARTYGVQVGHAQQMAAHEALGDLVIGYQIHALLDQHTRPWHALRSGTIYYRNPESGQKHLWQAPHPPLESDDPGERPAGTPHIAWNCRCWLSPVLASSETIQTDPDFQSAHAAGKFIPEPTVFSDWFSAADEPHRKLAVGARRYATIERLLGEPEWAHFLNPETGDLMTLDALRRESETHRQRRIARVRELLNQRGQEISGVATFGFIPRQ